MKKRSLPALLTSMALLTLVGMSAASPSAAKIPSAPRPPAIETPIRFVENVGQFAAGARFEARGADTALFLADDAIWISLIDEPPAALDVGRRPIASAGNPGSAAGPALRAAQPPAVRGVNLKISYVGANPHPRIEPFGRLSTSMSYFRGERAAWRAHAPVWGGVYYRDIYPAIDLELTGAYGHIEQRLLARPGADLRVVQLKVEGADALAVENSSLRITTAAGDVRMPLPSVVGSAALATSLNQAPAIQGDTISAPFSRPATAAPAATLQAATPDLAYSTFIGGDFHDESAAFTIDASGAAYVTGLTFSPNFPFTPGAFDVGCGTDGQCNADGSFYYYDAFVVKLNPDGTPAYMTFIGGEHGDGGGSIAIDSSGAAYVTGYTLSWNFPVTPNAYDSKCGSDRPPCNYDGTSYYHDAFVVKLNPAGDNLEFATFIGGANSDAGESIVVDANGAAYVTGVTFSVDFPATSGAFDTTCGTDGLCSYDGARVYADGFAVKLGPNGANLTYGTFLGGSGVDWATDLALGVNGAVYVTGRTTSPDFPATTGAFDETCGADGTCNTKDGFSYYDAFAIKIKPSGADAAYATYLGHANGEGGQTIAVDQNGNAYVAGYTFSSSGFPASSGAFDTSFNGYIDAFVVRLAADGGNVIYGTLLGGSDADDARDIAINGNGKAYVAGHTFSSGFPVTTNAFDSSFNGAQDAFLAVLNDAGTHLTYGSFLGGSGPDAAYGIALDLPSGAIYLSGASASPEFPTTPGAYDTIYAGNMCGSEPNTYPCPDAFITKLTAPKEPEPGPKPQPEYAFLPMMMLIPAQVCDVFEPNDDRRVDPYGPLTIGQSYQARLCADDAEDNFYFDVTANTQLNVAVTLPPSLVSRASVWVYDQLNFGQAICGAGPITAAPFTLQTCPVFAPGRYVVRLYTADSTVFDDQNSYALQVASP